MFIENQGGFELLQKAKYSFCTSATLGGEVGRLNIKLMIENIDPNQDKKVECYIDAYGFSEQGKLIMNIKDIAQKDQKLDKKEIREKVLDLAFDTVIEKTE